MPGDHADYLEWLLVNQNRFVDPTRCRKQRISDIIANHANVGATARFQVVKETAFFEIKRGGHDIIRYRPADQNITYFAVGILDAAYYAGSRYGDHQVGIWCHRDHAIECVRIFGLDFFAITIVPPVIDFSPRPLPDIEDVVAEDRHAFVEAGLDSTDGGAHQRHGDDADNDTERGEGGTRQVRAHLRSGDFPAFAELVEKTSHPVVPGSTGCQPVAFGSLAECVFVGAKIEGSKKTVSGKLPRTAGCQPAFPETRIRWRYLMVALARLGRVPE